jgi:serine protease
VVGAALAVAIALARTGGSPLAAESSSAQGDDVRLRVRGLAGPVGTNIDAQPLQLTPERAQAFVDAAERGLNYLPGEVLVKFKPGTTFAGQQRALIALRSRPDASALKWVGDVALLTDPSQPNSQILADQLSRQPEVEYAEPNGLAYVSPQPNAAWAPLSTGWRANATPSDPAYATRQWNLPMVQMPGAWDIQPGGRSDIVVAIVDTGITNVNQSYTFPLWTGTAIQNFSLAFATSPDLPASRLAAARDFIFSAPGGAVLDMVGHGTHVASTVGEATNNGVSLAGIAYNVQIMPVKVCIGYWEVQIARSAAGTPGFAPLNSGGCAIDAIASGIRYAADNGARVINLSLSGPSQQITVRDAITYAVSRGVFVSMSMGNEYEQGNPIRYPAFYGNEITGAMAVAAVGRTTQRAYYSNTGLHSEVAAPGGDGRAGGDAGLVWQVTLNQAAVSPFLIVPRFDTYAETGFQGTSMAAPHVAGIAALLISQGITSPAQLERRIADTAQDIGAPGRDNDFGYGLIQARTALYGKGIIR